MVAENDFLEKKKYIFFLQAYLRDFFCWEPYRAKNIPSRIGQFSIFVKIHRRTSSSRRLSIAVVRLFSIRSPPSSFSPKGAARELSSCGQRVRWRGSNFDLETKLQFSNGHRITHRPEYYIERHYGIFNSKFSIWPDGGARARAYPDVLLYVFACSPFSVSGSGGRFLPLSFTGTEPLRLDRLLSRNISISYVRKWFYFQAVAAVGRMMQRCGRISVCRFVKYVRRYLGRYLRAIRDKIKLEEVVKTALTT